jgi:hypothetical protein
MEPSDKAFARSYHFIDVHGEDIDLGASIGGRSHASSATTTRQRLVGAASSSSAAEGKSATSRRRTKQLSASSGVSSLVRFSENTLVQSVLLADGLVSAGDDNDEEELLREIPSRYKKGSVKSKITWFGVLCLAGVGMFVEAYVIITTGQVKTVWHDNYPECWDSEKDQPCPQNIECCGLFPNTPQDICTVSTTTTTPNEICTSDNEYPTSLQCSSRQLGGVSYAEFAGIMVGMLTFGTIADLIGRKKAGSLTALFMIAGIGGMTYFDSSDYSRLFLLFSIFFGIFGVGVGGEYPLTASQAAEYHAESAARR